MRKRTPAFHSTASTPKPPEGGLNSHLALCFIFLLLLCGLKVTAQEEIINNTTVLIAMGKYKDAEKYLDSIIRIEPKNVTALMMKGNVILNYTLMETPARQEIAPEDESIFSKDVATLKNHVVVIPKTEAVKVEQLWKQCLRMDSSRLDIQKGLCSLYGMALMRDELLGLMPAVAKSSRDKGDDFAYTMIEYATLLHERGDKEGTYLVYKKITELYPTVSGIRCLLAGVYFADNDLVHARESAERGITTVNADMTVCHDAMEIYSAIAEPAKVLAVLKIASKDSGYKDYLFQLAIYKFAYHDSSWKKDIKAYLNQFKTAPDSNAVYAAASVMALKNFPDNYEGIGALLSYNLNDLSARLLTARAIKEYKDSTQPYVIAALVMLNDKNYAKSNELLGLLSQKHPGANDILYYYAYSLYCAKEYKQALVKWTAYIDAVKTMKSSSPDLDTYLATPYYFAGQCYLNTGNKAKALEYFKMIEAGKDESKYAYLAKIMLDKIK